ncbi:MAG: arylsulfatase [Bacteroidales bacterium]|nr:arylsulfatase [Bacteroidales bacterium]
MRLKSVALFAITLFTQLQCSTNRSVEKLNTPNIIVILADDFGVGDIQRHYPENKIPTPHLDQLVDEGVSFTDAHSSSAVCSPTRYGLLTGRYNWRTPLQEWVIACYEPPLIKKERTTLPEILQYNGYHTACVGKWHLGWNWPGDRPGERLEERNVLKNYQWDFSKPITGGPTDHGFDYYFGVEAPNYPPFTYIENDRVVELPKSQYHFDPDEGVVMPRFFDGSPMAPGWKFDRILSDLTEKAVEYIHTQSKSDQPFFLYFSMTSPHEPVVPSEQFKGKSGIAPIADFVMETDWSAGQIINAVRNAGISENTIIIFTADNGHSDYTGWDDLVKAGHMPSGPYRGHKKDIWEGGHRVPFIARWDGVIEEGSVSEQLVCLTDLYATFNELIAGKQPSQDEAEDSFSFLDILTGKAVVSERDHLVSHSVRGEFAYRKANWKMVYRVPDRGLGLWEELDSARGKPACVELYNLKDDIGEAHDSLAFYPELARELQGEFKNIVERGTSRKGRPQANDVEVSFEKLQTARWADK